MKNFKSFFNNEDNNENLYETDRNNRNIIAPVKGCYGKSHDLFSIILVSKSILILTEQNAGLDGISSFVSRVN